MRIIPEKVTDEQIDLIIKRTIELAIETDRVHEHFVMSKKAHSVLKAKIKARINDPIFPEMIDRDIAMQVGAFLIGFQYGFDAGIQTK